MAKVAAIFRPECIIYILSLMFSEICTLMHMRGTCSASQHLTSLTKTTMFTPIYNFNELLVTPNQAKILLTIFPTLLAVQLTVTAAPKYYFQILKSILGYSRDANI